MRQVIDGLEPKALWKHFFEISRIPRCSKREQGVRDYVLAVARQRGVGYQLDGVGNVVISRPGDPGHEQGPIVVLQAHLDMVCEKDKETPHDFATDGVRLKKDGDWICAEGTTLGADNGIGVAACLAVLETMATSFGPLEILLTVDEETGLTGALGMDPHILKGRMLINTDSEEDGAIYIGCAGGLDTELRLEADTETIPDGAALRIRVGGLRGGHSGIEIHEGRTNAIKLLARFLRAHESQTGLRIAHLEGGTKRNAIPRECEAVVVLPHGRIPDLRQAAAAFAKTLQGEYARVDPGVVFSVHEDGFTKPERVLRPSCQKRVVNLLCGLPNGVMAMSHAVPGLVETSTNVGIVETADGAIRIATSQRSSVPTQLAALGEMVRAIGELAGAQIRQGSGYPGWEPNPDSPLLKSAAGVFRSLFGRDPQIKAIHAGLECGIIGARFAGMDMISFGPTITGAHSPFERVRISTVKRFWDFLMALLQRLA